MMVMVALLRMPWFGTEVVSSNLVPPPYVSLWIMPLFLDLLVSWAALGVFRIFSPSLGRTSLFGPTVLTSSLSSLLFLASLHWPQGDPDLGKFGVSYFELLLLFEIYAGHRLHAEKAIGPHLRPRRLLFFSGFPVDLGQEIRHGCQFLHSLFRSLGHHPGGLVRFIPCHPSAHYTRLMHVGWGQCGHGLSSRPRESCDLSILTPLLDFFGYPVGAATELYSGTLKLRYSSTPFSKKFPSCPIPDLSGQVIRWFVPVLDPVFIFRIETL